MCTALVVDWLEAKGSEGVDVVVAPEALGFVFAGSIAAAIQKPLVLIRKQGKLPGDVDSVPSNGSNMQKLVDDSVRLGDRLEQDAHACPFDMVADSIVAG
jgi:adenine/guanine phosphoribosyltransferase-like PRPP-binding protein